ncbi:MAG: TatD family hydrolase [Bacteroidota bacterium]|nr:TatD family hydrolase [Bacteroidota bacterium]MDP4250052.1 TatD family hydrolase [Bacteroidota bacterium]
MELIDSHCHLYLRDFADDISEVMERAVRAGVSRFYLPSIDRENESLLFDLERRYPEVCFAMQGLHPCSVKEDFREELKRVETSLAARSFAAVGEIGLDFYWDRSFEAQQYQAFHRQIEWALHYALPIVIHSRQSIAQSIAVVKEHQKGKLAGIFHCFNEDEKSAQEIIALGFYLGIGGTVTYKNSRLPEVLKNIPLENIVLETDAPYLPPVPFRGKRNESSYISYVASKIAEIKDLPPETVASVTSANALKIFAL